MRIACSEENCTCVGFVGVGKLGTNELCVNCGHQSSFHDDIFETTEDSLARLVDRFVVEMTRKDARIRELEQRINSLETAKIIASMSKP